MSDLKSFGDLDREWREQKSFSLGRSIQAKIHQIMNPKNCTGKKRFFCNFNYTCGFTCEIHHVVHCLNTAIYYDRPLVLDSSRWRYSKGHWESTFKPISNTCQNITFNASYDQVLPIIHRWKKLSKEFFPLAIPKEVADDLMHIHGDPVVWWLGQLLAYVWKHQPLLSRHINEVKEKIGFKTPYVGVHVRRTDKLLRDAKLHPIEEYMDVVEEYYNERELRGKIDRRRVFLATDEPMVVNRARKIYPHYEIMNDLSIAQSAGTKIRYNFKALLGVATDITLLSQSDFLVCTFSSNVCRAAYELMQVRHGDASQHARSLDRVYWFFGQKKHFVKATERHLSHHPTELNFFPGDEILLINNKWNGYSIGEHKTSGKRGIFPSYKVKDTVRTANYSVNFLET